MSMSGRNAPSGSFAVEASGLTKRYGDKVAVDDVDLWPSGPGR